MLTAAAGDFAPAVADEAGRRLLVHAASRPATATKIVKERKRRDV
jgi:hypothetical protein